MSNRTVTLIPGDGIGPEVAAATVKVIEATAVPIQWETYEAGTEVFNKYGTPVPNEVFQSIVRNRWAIKGPITTPIGAGYASVNVLMRKTLNLYANVRPAKSSPGISTPFKNVDIVVVRENSEDLYSGLEHVVVPGVVESLKIITETASLRIARYAFEFAQRHNRKKVTAVHKANIMKKSDGLFLECCQKVARDFPNFEYSEIIVDNACMQLVTKPHQFDVMVMPNLYGDILSDLCAGLVGGLGLAPSVNVGENVHLYEAVHGSAPDIAGRNLANPIALILSGAMMLVDMGEIEAADRIERAVLSVLERGETLTGDLGGKATTTELTDAIIHEMRVVA
ncbi:MAG: isocitrate dehydrogenase (NAD(+)) [Armatimonadetes bacterium]|nr:isocitrate dehydrogenase (NAD(+)) [Armatimonadota bacterium]